MTCPPPDRPLPDAADLRLLAELSRAGGTLDLARAAWQAGMPTGEAVVRLDQLAASGFPLRLVVQGDPALLWQVVQRGPVATGPAPAPPGPPPSSPLATPPAPPPSSPEPAATWGLPGSSAWTRREPPGSPAGAASGRAVPPPTPQASRSAAAAETTAAETAAAGVPLDRLQPAVGSPARTTGLEGEQLTVTVRSVIDPATGILTTAGYVLDADERAVLVQTAVANAGPAPHDCMPDLYLFLVDAAGRTLAKAPVSVAGYPAHRVGVPAGSEAEGWTVFLIAADAELAAVRWCVRPDLADRTLTWSVR